MNYDFSQYAEQSSSGGGGSSVFSFLVSIATVVAWWFLFVKAGEEGWKAIIPFYDLYTIFDIVYGNGLKCLLLLVPILNVILLILFPFRLCKAYGKGAGFGVLMLLFSPIMMLYLAFDKNTTYYGPVASFI